MPRVSKRRVGLYEKLPTARPDEVWKRWAMCRGMDPEDFYSRSQAKIREAKRLCAICPVRNACREYALTWREGFGVWGETSVKDRNMILGVKLDGT